LTPYTAPEPVERTPWQRWVGFWFPASDPTTLGFVRICTGLLVLYIHLAYSVDLQQFFGKQGWYSAQFVDRERREYPWQVSPFWTWDPQPALPARVPDFPHRRKAVVDFIRGLPAEDGPRHESLKFLDRVARTENPDAALLMLRWFHGMGTSADVRDRYLAALVGGRPTESTRDATSFYLGRTPSFLLDAPPADREQLATEVRAFWHVLPADQTAREYVLNHLTEMPQEVRRSFVQFLDTLPTDKAARDKRIEYLDYWNAEPERAVRTGHAIFSVWFHVSDPTQMALIHVGILLLIALWTLGLFTRVTGVLVWIAVVGYIHRTQQVLFGMDTMMNIILFYLMIGNSGAALSLDRLIGRYRAARASLRRSGAIDDPTRAYLASPPPSKGAGFALRLIQVHFCFIYIAAGLSKLKGGAWWNGQAFWDVVVNPEFTLMQYQWYEDGLRAMARIKPVYHAMAAGGVWSTLFIEIAGPFLLWTRLRWLIIFLATAMHAVIGVMMGLNLFELLMIIMLVAFMPDGVIRDRLRGGLDLAKLAFAFGPSAPSARAAALVVAVDTDSQVTLAPDPALAVPSLTVPDGKKLTGPEGVTALFRSVRLLSLVSFVLWVPGVRGLLAKWLFPAPAVAQPPTAPKSPAPAAAS
ncbi:MAG: hypothetical protein J0I06_21690, partial [Planctomycetes bacterium]|nr:hypothetical protein [Planctomycetota bacterium]